MSSHMEATRLEQFLVHILTPVYRIIEDDTIRDSQMSKFPPQAKYLLIKFEPSRTQNDSN